jgi:hypothetical protein
MRSRTKRYKTINVGDVRRNAVSLEGLKYEATELARAHLLEVTRGKMSASRSLDDAEHELPSQEEDRWMRQHTHGVIRLEAMISDAGDCLMETESIEPFAESEL